MSEGDDIKAFLAVFERVMTAQEILKERWAYMLAPQLTGKAQQAYATLSATNAGDYDAVKEAILIRYDISTETYRQRFRQAKQKTRETPRELATRLQDLAGKWLKDCSTVEAIREVILLEQPLPPDIRVWLRDRKPDTSVKAGQLAEDYLQARRPARTTVKQEMPRKGEKNPGGGQRCHACGELGHFARDCKRGATGKTSGGTKVDAQTRGAVSKQTTRAGATTVDDGGILL